MIAMVSATTGCASSDVLRDTHHGGSSLRADYAMTPDEAFTCATTVMKWLGASEVSEMPQDRAVTGLVMAPPMTTRDGLATRVGIFVTVDDDRSEVAVVTRAVNPFFRGEENPPEREVHRYMSLCARLVKAGTALPAKLPDPYGETVGMPR